MKTKNAVIVKSNDLIEASYRLSLDEMRVLLLTIGRVDPTIKNHHRDFEFTVSEFAERFNADEKSAYKQVQQAIDKLCGRLVVVEQTTKFIRKVTLLTQQVYFYGDGRFKIILHEELMPFVSEISSKFTLYSLENVAKLNSFHAIRIYEILTQYRAIGYREILVSELKEWLQVEDKYPRYNSFNQRVLTPSISEINEKSDLLVSVEQIKRGRTIHALKFKITQKSKELENLEKTKKRENADIFAEFSEVERKAVQERIDEYVQLLESKGETVSEFRRKNITKKAIKERWGLDALAKKQEEANKRKARETKELQERQIELEQQAEKERLSKQRKQKLIEIFESLTSEQQEKVLDEVGKTPQVSLFKKSYNEKRVKGEKVYIDPKYAYQFYKYFGIE